MTKDLHRKVHNVSHFQISLVRSGSPLQDFAVGGVLVNVTATEINVATAWDDNGRVAPEVEIAVTGFAVPVVDAFPPLTPVTSAIFEVADDGVEVGNWISDDVAKIDVPPGRYHVLVSMDSLEPMTARRVHFHFWPLSA
jgi:hypothetical protein